MAAHRYWRIKATAVNGGGSFVAASEIEFRTSVFGSDVTGSGTALSDSDFGGLPKANAYDNNISTLWACNGTGTSAWIGYDFGSGNDKDIVAAVWTGRNDGSFTQYPTAVNVDFSDNGTVWTTKFSGTISFSGAGQSALLYDPATSFAGVTHRYWRVNLDSSYNSGSFLLSELELRTSIGGANIAGSATITASATTGGNVASNLKDGNTATIWEADFAGAATLTVDLGSGNDAEVKEVMMQNVANGNYIFAPASGRVFSSPDGVTYVLRYSFANKSIGVGSQICCPDPAYVPAGATTHRYWGLTFSSVQNGSTSVSWDEIEFRDTVGGADNTTGKMAIANNRNTVSPAGTFDDNTGSLSDHSLLNKIIACDYGFGNEKSCPAQIALTSNAATSAPTAFALIYSDDNEHWTTQESFTSPATWTNDLQRLFTVTSAATPWVPRILVC